MSACLDRKRTLEVCFSFALHREVEEDMCGSSLEGARQCIAPRRFLEDLRHDGCAYARAAATTPRRVTGRTEADYVRTVL